MLKEEIIEKIFKIKIYLKDKILSLIGFFNKRENYEDYV